MVNSFFRLSSSSVYEIYPRSETPRLTQIARVNFDHPPAHLLSDTVVWHSFSDDTIVFSVWDYRLNHSISFSVYVDVEEFEENVKVYFNLSKALKFFLTRW